MKSIQPSFSGGKLSTQAWFFSVESGSPQLAMNDLWRIAKDTDYYLGRPFTPVDWFKRILDLSDRRDER